MHPTVLYQLAGAEMTSYGSTAWVQRSRGQRPILIPTPGCV